MGNWSGDKPCRKCGRIYGEMVKCTNCNTVGCTVCVGSPGKSTCRVCKKDVEKVRE